MKRVLFTYDYGSEAMQQIRELGYEILYIKENELTGREREIVEFDPEALVCYAPFETLPLNEMKSLKWIQLSSIGVDQVPVTSVLERGIAITNNRGGYSIPMGEWIVYEMLSFYKFGVYFSQNQRERKWKLNSKIRELTGRKALFIGTGTIAKEAVKRLSGFDVHCLGINTRGADTEGFEKCYPMEALESLLPDADFVILTIPYTKATEKLIDESKLNLMKADAVLINVARGSLIDEAQLIESLSQGKFLGVALDVFENEPLSQDSLLWGLERVKITPHNSWISEYRNERRFNLIYENLKSYASGKDLINIVNLKRGY